ncbi:MAG: hypothetical protein R3246_17345, partial [Acidimicrobiia bacterium]|nr:hypothetical protein [Acidimicrobiia bacterium]
MKIRTGTPARFVLALCTVVLVAACGDDEDPTGLDPDEFELSIVSGGGSTGIATTVVTEPLVVEVTRRADGAPEQGVRVNWSVIGGVGKPTRPSSATRADGRASTLVELGQAAGAVRLSASVAGLPSVTFPDLTVLPAPTLAGVSPSVADPGDTVEVRVNDYPDGFATQVLFDGVPGEITAVQAGSPAVLDVVVPAPVGVCSAAVEDVDVRVRVGGLTTSPLTLGVSVPADPFEVGQVLVIEAPDSTSGDVECALLPSD